MPWAAGGSRLAAACGSRLAAGGWRLAAGGWRLAKVYRSSRWTWCVRDTAIERASGVGRTLALAVPVAIGASIVLAAAFFGLVAAS